MLEKLKFGSICSCIQSYIVGQIRLLNILYHDINLLFMKNSFMKIFRVKIL